MTATVSLSSGRGTRRVGEAPGEGAPSRATNAGCLTETCWRACAPIENEDARIRKPPANRTPLLPLASPPTCIVLLRYLFVACRCCLRTGEATRFLQGSRVRPIEIHNEPGLPPVTPITPWPLPGATPAARATCARTRS